MGIFYSVIKGHGSKKGNINILRMALDFLQQLVNIAIRFDAGCRLQVACCKLTERKDVNNLQPETKTGPIAQTVRAPDS